VHRLLTEGWVESAKTDAARGAKAYLQPIKKAAATAAAETKSAKF